jgi:hypothetical protein
MVEESADATPGGFAGSWIGFAQQDLELGEDLLDRAKEGITDGSPKRRGEGQPPHFCA